MSIFGLTLSFLDILSPKEIWSDIEIADLRKSNIQSRDFFLWARESTHSRGYFDLVLGNPPFNPIKGAPSDPTVEREVLTKFGIRPNEIPKRNLALKFLKGAIYFGKKVCLVLPANAMLYDRSEVAMNFRVELFSRQKVDKIFDLTHLRRILFHHSAEVPVVSLILVPKEPEPFHAISHVVIKRQQLSEKQIRLEMDHYDWHSVPLNWAVDKKKQFIWKTNLFGGGRLFHLIYRLSLLPRLEDYIQARRAENREWIAQDGYKNRSNTPREGEEISFLYQQDNVSEIAPNGELVIDDDPISVKYFGRPRPERLYWLPLVLIHKKIGNNRLPVGIKHSHHRKILAFNSGFIGIHALKMTLTVWS